jgi:hypothetical protein
MFLKKNRTNFVNVGGLLAASNYIKLGGDSLLFKNNRTVETLEVFSLMF